MWHRNIVHKDEVRAYSTQEQPPHATRTSSVMPGVHLCVSFSHLTREIDCCRAEDMSLEHNKIITCCYQ